MRALITLFVSFGLIACDPASDGTSTGGADLGPGTGGMTEDAGAGDADLMADVHLEPAGSLVLMPAAVEAVRLEWAAGSVRRGLQ